MTRVPLLHPIQRKLPPKTLTTTNAPVSAHDGAVTAPVPAVEEAEEDEEAVATGAVVEDHTEALLLTTITPSHGLPTTASPSLHHLLPPTEEVLSTPLHPLPSTSPPCSSPSAT